MAKSNAERQAAYRVRHLGDKGGKSERVNFVIDQHAKLALERLAICYAVTQRTVLERILVEVEQATLASVATIPNGPADYYKGRLRLSLDGITP
ncbi:hypothetical protein SAMN05216420_11375 [Nitrosospira sp. Nl5]|uniref:hypothetical protein n=1 Tax=Nitrosospira sp. Nl5 TaxID=200120 RepID=UPI00088AC2C5|nr:hypothetical protein [Nitrosospira sp. Nl5]SCY69993.1 hypothetical protein SAMN05216420_11375 [Nitrosospira sp. Nl5]